MRNKCAVKRHTYIGKHVGWIIFGLMHITGFQKLQLLPCLSFLEMFCVSLKRQEELW